MTPQESIAHYRIVSKLGEGDHEQRLDAGEQPGHRLPVCRIAAE
jgi:hypothetical protein